MPFQFRNSQKDDKESFFTNMALQDLDFEMGTGKFFCYNLNKISTLCIEHASL